MIGAVLLVSSLERVYCHSLNLSISSVVIAFGKIRGKSRNVIALYGVFASICMNVSTLFKGWAWKIVTNFMSQRLSLENCNELYVTMNFGWRSSVFFFRWPYCTVTMNSTFDISNDQELLTVGVKIFEPIAVLHILKVACVLETISTLI